MTPQEALSDALTKVIGGEEIFENQKDEWPYWAGLILEALPSGWTLSSSAVALRACLGRVGTLPLVAGGSERSPGGTLDRDAVLRAIEQDIDWDREPDAD